MADWQAGEFTFLGNRNCVICFQQFSCAGQEIILCWIPGHAGSAGNEKTDTIVKTGLGGRPTIIHGMQ